MDVCQAPEESNGLIQLQMLSVVESLLEIQRRPYELWHWRQLILRDVKPERQTWLCERLQAKDPEIACLDGHERALVHIAAHTFGVRHGAIRSPLPDNRDRYDHSPGCRWCRQINRRKWMSVGVWIEWQDNPATGEPTKRDRRHDAQVAQQNREWNAGRFRMRVKLHEELRKHPRYRMARGFA